MLNRLQQLLMVTGALLVALPAIEAKANIDGSGATTQAISQIAQAGLVQITGVQVEDGEVELQVILETAGGESQHR